MELNRRRFLQGLIMAGAVLLGGLPLRVHRTWLRGIRGSPGLAFPGRVEPFDPERARRSAPWSG